MKKQTTAAVLNLFILTTAGTEQASISDCVASPRGSVICYAETADHAEFLNLQYALGKIEAAGRPEFGRFESGNNLDSNGHL